MLLLDHTSGLVAGACAERMGGLGTIVLARTGEHAEPSRLVTMRSQCCPVRRYDTCGFAERQPGLPQGLAAALLVVADRTSCWADRRHGKLPACHWGRREWPASASFGVREICAAANAAAWLGSSHEHRLALCAGAKSDPSDLVDKFNLPEASRRMIRKVQLAELSTTGAAQTDIALLMVVRRCAH